MEYEPPAQDVNRSNEFGAREVGLTHPDVPSFIRLGSNGSIEIVASEGLSIVLNPRNNSITFNADTVKFFTRSGGFRWNTMELNERATSFNQPTFLPISAEEESSLYQGVDYYLEEEEEAKPRMTRVEFLKSLRGQ